MESKGTYIHTRTKVLQAIDDWYIEESNNILNKTYYGIKSEKKTDLKKYRFLKAFDNILCRAMHCDFEVTDSLLEAVSIYSLNSYFKVHK